MEEIIPTRDESIVEPTADVVPEVVAELPVQAKSLGVPDVPPIEIETPADIPVVATETTPTASARSPRDNRDNRNSRATGNRGGKQGGNRGGSRARAPREKPEFDSKMISIRRVTRVVSGGRRFSLSVAVVAGDRNGRIGLGTGKAQDTQLAIEKALKQAKRKMMTLRLTKNKALPHDISAKFKSSEVIIMPNKGKGLIAGSSARVIFALAGVKDVTAKFNSGSKNKLNNARATMKALLEVAYAYDEAPVAATKMVEVIAPVAVVTE
jgi:small subunit ribosomal protein S5